MPQRLFLGHVFALLSDITFDLLLPNGSFFLLCPLYINQMTNVEIRAAQRIGAALLKQSREKMRDQQQHLGQSQGD